MKRFFPVIFASALLLSGCQSVSNWFSDAGEPALPGERISILQLQKELTPDLSLQNIPPQLPEAWTNRFWPQVGGYPNHAMGHLAIGAELKRAWKTSIGAGGSRRSPLTTAPVVAEGRVFTLDTDGTVSSFDLSGGARKWRQSIVPRGEEETGAVGGGIAYASGALFATAGYKNLTALNADSGEMLWKSPIPAPARAAPTVIGDKVMLVTLDNRLLVYSANDGTLLWKYAGLSETTNLLGAAAAAADNSLVVLPLSSGELYGLTPDTGRILWQDNLSAVRRFGALASISDIRGLPVIDEGIVYAASYSGRMVALDKSSGQRLWQREVGSAETPWVAGDSVFILTAEQQLVALARTTGGIRWVAQLPRHRKNDADEQVIWMGPVLAGGRLLLTGSDEALFEIDPATGKVLKSTDIGSAAVAPPVVADNTVLILTQSGDLSAWR